MYELSFVPLKYRQFTERIGLKKLLTANFVRVLEYIIWFFPYESWTDHCPPILPAWSLPLVHAYFLPGSFIALPVTCQVQGVAWIHANCILNNWRHNTTRQRWAQNWINYSTEIANQKLSMRANQNIWAWWYCKSHSSKLWIKFCEIQFNSIQTFARAS